MIVIDSSALIAILRREPEADDFLRVIAKAEGCLLSSVSLLETSLVLPGRTGDARSWAELDALIARAGIEVVSQDAELTEQARTAFLRYGRAAILPPSISATAHPMPSPSTATCRSCSRAMTSRKPIFRRRPHNTGFLVFCGFLSPARQRAAAAIAPPPHLAAMGG